MVKKFFVTWVLLVILQIATIGTVIYYIHEWWVDNQVSQRIEIFADMNFPVKK